MPSRRLLAALATVALVSVGTIAHADNYRLPWTAGQSVFVTQDCNDSCCNDHVGHNEFAWDFATRGAFEVVAPRAGTIVHVKMSSNRGGDADEVDAANYIVIDHGDGTASIMLHLAHGSLDPNVHCGEFVRAGQHLATTGATGWASGNHLHYQVNRIPPGMNRTCECGPDGMGCGEEESHWDLFWSRDDASRSVPIAFDEWPDASVCGDRHDGTVLRSQNVPPHATRDTMLALTPTDNGRFVALTGAFQNAWGGVRGGNWLQSVPGQPAAGLVSFAGRIPEPGVYEVWSALPARGRNVGVSRTRVEVIARGEDHRESESQAVPGGGFHPIAGRFKLTGRPGEGLVLACSGNPAESLAVDSVLLRRVADAGSAGAGAACSSSIECSGDLVCAGGHCAAGCESSGCANGLACTPMGLCVASPMSTEQQQVAYAANVIQRATSPVAPAHMTPVRTVEAAAAPGVAPSASGGGRAMKTLSGALKLVGMLLFGAASAIFGKRLR